ncbi:jmjC domain-containing protein 8 isoform X2 [Onychostruthus taczanowskii]|uniref:jmjC domain-containing protein 8 isoform X2 n=1 Tax=Onychostruthus taczanowskii TaxID=356909 RepID=UPI001B8009B0|nr:jmjC domain-containing protein 8 isoform X2 [Onychostruthus taczanowskii]
MAAAARLLLLLVVLGWVRPGACTDPPGGGWLAGTVPEEPRCTVERADASLTYSLFLQRFAFSRPVILGGVTDNSVSAARGQRVPGGTHLPVPRERRQHPGSPRSIPQAFRALCTRDKLLAAFGPFPVRLSTANTYSYRKVDVPFQEYVEHLLKPQDPARLGSALRAPSLPHPGHQPRLQLWDRRLRLWRSLPLARPWFLRGDFRQEALVPVPAGPNPALPPQREHAGLAPAHLSHAAAGPAPAGVHPAPRGGLVLPRPLVARHTQPGHQRLHLHLPGLGLAGTRTPHHHPSQTRSSSSCHPQGQATGIGTNCLRQFPGLWIKVVLLKHAVCCYIPGANLVPVGWQRFPSQDIPRNGCCEPLQILFHVYC